MGSLDPLVSCELSVALHVELEVDLRVLVSPFTYFASSSAESLVKLVHLPTGLHTLVLLCRGVPGAARRCDKLPLVECVPHTVGLLDVRQVDLPCRVEPSFVLVCCL